MMHRYLRIQYLESNNSMRCPEEIGVDRGYVLLNKYANYLQFGEYLITIISIV